MNLIREANKEVVNECLNYMRDSSNYKLDKLLQDRGLWLLPQTKARGTMISCPFHSDSSPSMIVDDDDKFHCFACNRSGKYWDMEYFLRTFRQGVKIGRYAVLEDLLRNDPRMQLSVGHTSIYVTKTVERPERQPFRPTPRQVASLLEVSSVMKKEKLISPQLIKLAILSAQDGMKPFEVLRVVRDAGKFESTADVGPQEEISLSDILGGFEIDLNFDESGEE